MIEILKELLDEVNIVYKKIQNSFSSDKRIALLELTRALDHGYVYANYINKNKGAEEENVRKVLQFMSTGFATCLKLFYDDSTKEPGCPFYPTNKEMIDWANSCLMRMGHVGNTLRFIELAE